MDKIDSIKPEPLIVLDGAALHRANFVWTEDWDYGIIIINRLYNVKTIMKIFKHFLEFIPKNHNRYYELSPLVPFAMMLIMTTIIFILIIFRRWPSLVAGIVAGCLTSVSIYLLLLTLKEEKVVYE